MRLGRFRTRSTGRSDHLALGAALTAAAIIVASCGAAAPTGNPGGQSGSLLPPLQETPGASANGGSGTSSGSGAGASPSPAAPASNPATSPASSVSPEAHAALVRIDPALLDVLPAEVDGNQLTESPEAETATASDPGVSRSVGRLAVAFVADREGLNWAVATVSALRPGLWSDAFFRDWRDTYDAGVCDQSGGVTGHAEADIGPRHVWIGTCANGVRTYHVHVDQGDLLVSVSALGDARFGEQLVAALNSGAAADVSATP